MNFVVTMEDIFGLVLIVGLVVYVVGSVAYHWVRDRFRGPRA